MGHFRFGSPPAKTFTAIVTGWRTRKAASTAAISSQLAALIPPTARPIINGLNKKIHAPCSLGSAICWARSAADQENALEAAISGRMVLDAIFITHASASPA
jgi:hypothetical protein